MKQITIIIPLYCSEQYLSRCLDSLLSQTYKDYSLILIDDGSNDSSGEICEEYASSFDSIIVIHQNNHGQASARNTGLDYYFECTESNWVMFVDSDDWIDSVCLEQMYFAAKKYNKNISMCSYKVVSDYTCNNNHKDNFIYKIIDAEEIYCKKNTLSVVPWAKLYNRDCFKNIRYPVGKICEDEFVTYKVLFQCSSIIYIDNPFYYYFYNEEGVSKNVWSHRKLVSLEALRNQIVFFQDNGYERAYNQALYNAAINISNNCLQVQDSTTIYDKEEYFRLLSREMRDILSFKNAKKVLLFSEFKHFYEIAYPGFMKQYWRFQSIKSKIKGRNSEKN